MITDPDPYAVALTVVRVLDSLGVVSTVGGSLASSFAGEPRSTIDIVAALEEPHVAGLISRLGAEFYADEDALRRAVRSTPSNSPAGSV